MKTCARCKEEKPKTEFNKASVSSGAKDGLYAYCKPCSSEIKTEYYRKNRDKIKVMRVKWRRKMMYNITMEEYEDLLTGQSNKCGICKTSFEEVRADVDHCHNTGKVRGLLCHGCNTGIGLFKENTESLNNAIKYLEQHNDTV